VATDGELTLVILSLLFVSSPVSDGGSVGSGETYLVIGLTLASVEPPHLGRVGV
jgi:hypothetical protein